MSKIKIRGEKLQVFNTRRQMRMSIDPKIKPKTVVLENKDFWYHIENLKGCICIIRNMGSDEGNWIGIKPRIIIYLFYGENDLDKCIEELEKYPTKNTGPPSAYILTFVLPTMYHGEFEKIINVDDTLKIKFTESLLPIPLTK